MNLERERLSMSIPPKSLILGTWSENSYLFKSRTPEMLYWALGAQRNHDFHPPIQKNNIGRLEGEHIPRNKNGIGVHMERDT